MAKIVASLNMDFAEPMLVGELREFLAMVPDEAKVTGVRYATYDSTTGEVEIS